MTILVAEHINFTGCEMPLIKIHNSKTDEVIEREMTEAELLEYQDNQEKVLQLKQQKIEKENTKKAVFLKLGLTEEEVKLLIGDK